MKSFLEDLLGIRISFNNFLLNLLFIMFYLICGQFLHKVNLLSSYEWNNNSNYLTMYHILSSIICFIPFFILWKWYKSWNRLISNTKNNSIKKETLSTNKYISYLLIILTVIYLIFIFAIKYLMDNYINLDYFNTSSQLSYLREYIFNPYLLLVYIFLVLYSLVIRNSRFLLYLNNIPLYVILTLYILKIDYLNLSSVNSINGFIFTQDRIYICLILIIAALSNFLCALLNYMIFGTGLSDLNCNHFNNYNYNYIKTLLQLTIFSFGLAFGISS